MRSGRPLPGTLSVYAWPSTTLREVAHLLYLADPALSRPHTIHDFRVVYFDPTSDRFEADAPVRGITRLPTGDARAEAAATLTLEHLRLTSHAYLECAMHTGRYRLYEP